MQQAIDETTSRFLEAAQADLQRHLGSIGTVLAMTVVPTGSVLRLDALVRIGHRSVIFSGAGESVFDAYGALTHSRPELRRSLPLPRILR